MSRILITKYCLIWISIIFFIILLVFRVVGNNKPPRYLELDDANRVYELKKTSNSYSVVDIYSGSEFFVASSTKSLEPFADKRVNLTGEFVWVEYPLCQPDKVCQGDTNRSERKLLAIAIKHIKVAGF